jgi:hypothetical protein
MLTQPQGVTVRQIFEYGKRRANAKTLSHVIETIQIFVDCISDIVDSWDTFGRAELLLFTKYAAGKRTVNKLHTVSSLSQTETAVAQGDDLKTLTK